MKTRFYALRYWWTDRTGEKTATTVASGRDPEDALRRWRAANSHISRSALIIKHSKPVTV